jgi:hypothetical protein
MQARPHTGKLSQPVTRQSLILRITSSSGLGSTSLLLTSPMIAVTGAAVIPSAMKG